MEQDGPSTAATADDLADLLASHNWDDGFELPGRILAHPSCSQGLALEIFWLADGIAWFQDKAGAEDDLPDWAAFCSRLLEHLLEHRYPSDGYQFSPQLGKTQRYKLLMAGIPPLLLGANDEPCN